MSDTTKIQWADSTWNPYIGCTKVSPGCANCYAEHSTPSRRFGVGWGDKAERRRSSEATRLAPLRWAKRPWVCDECGEACTASNGEGLGACPNCECTVYCHRRRVFSLSLGDWLDPQVPNEWLAEALDVIRRTPQLDYLLLTKRPENFDSRILDAELWLIDNCKRAAPHSRAHDMAATAAWLAYWRPGEHVPNNVWMGTSVENQEQTKHIRDLIRIPAALHWLSLEPLLGPLDISQWLHSDRIDWLVIGGESGPRARPCNVEWIRDLLRQAKEAGVPAFVKQLGAFSTVGPCQLDGRLSYSRTNTHHPKGGDPAEWPEDLRVRQWPERKA